MSISKKAVSFALALMLTAQTSAAVFGDYEYDYNSSETNAENNQTAYQDNDNYEEFKQNEENKDYDSFEEKDGDLTANENDPGFESNLTSSFTYWQNMFASGIWGSDNLIHNSKFNNYNKVYGIDVSYYQGNIDWKKVKAAGVKYAIIRVGYRGYGNGALVRDSKLYEYLDGAKAQGIKVGVYFYTQAINTAEAKAEADYVVNSIRGYSLDMPVYYDIEGVDYDIGRLDAQRLNKTQMTALCTAFCDRIKSYGYQAGVYTNKSWFIYKIDGKALGKKYPIWLAHYTTRTDYENDYQIWQYTGSGIVNGIPNYVDMNVAYQPKNTTPVVTDDFNKKKVSGIKTISSTKNQIVLKWNKLDKAEGYAVYTRNADGKLTYRGDTTSTSMVIGKLDSSTVYNFVVKGYKNTNGNTGFTVKSILSADSADFKYGTKPETPINLKVTGKTSDSISIKWDKPAGKINGYQPALYDPNTKTYTDMDTVTSNSYTFKNLEPDTQYQFAVKSYYKDGSTSYFGSYSETVSDSTKDGEIIYTNSVTGFKAYDTAQTKVMLKWDNTEGADGYAVYYKNKKGEYILKGTTTDTNFTITGLSMAQVYKFNVKPYKNKSNAGSEFTDESVLGSFTDDLVQGTKTVKANKVTVLNRSSKNIEIKWEPSSGRVDGYQVAIYDPATKKHNCIDYVDNDKCKYVFKNLKSGTDYQLTVRPYYSVNGVKYPGVFADVTKDSTRLATVSGIKFLSFGKNSVHFKWNKSEGADYYLIYRVQNGAYTQVKKTASYNDVYVSGLKDNENVTIVIKAVRESENGNQESSYSSAYTVKYKPVSPDPSASQIKTNSAKISWNKTKGSTGYKVYIYNSNKKAWEVNKTVSANTDSISVTGLNSKKNIKVKVSAIYNSAEKRSPEIAFKTK